LVEEQRRREEYFNITELKATGKKEDRIRGLIPMFRNGVIKHRKHMKELEDELLTFPVGKYDDVIDSLAYLQQLLKPTRYMPEEVQEGNYWELPLEERLKRAQQKTKAFDKYKIV
jgi:hypothetical protein